MLVALGLSAILWTVSFQAYTGEVLTIGVWFPYDGQWWGERTVLDRHVRT